MDTKKIILENGVEKEVNCIFYSYNSIYYLIYTEKEIDENNYVILHVVKVGKETENTPAGPIDTGYMIGVEITDPNEWKNVQNSISKIVESKKNNTTDPQIQYLSSSMIGNLKILGKKTFRLMKDLIQNSFELSLDKKETVPVNEVIQPLPQETNNIEGDQVSIPLQNIVNNTNEIPKIEQQDSSAIVPQSGDVVVDYRTAFFEEQEKNKSLQTKIDELTLKLENVKKIIE